MKNKKLLTRIFALLASLVLVVALALPCFADSAPQSPDISKAVRVDSLDDMLVLIDDPYVVGNYYPIDIYISDVYEYYLSGTIFIGDNYIEATVSNSRFYVDDINALSVFFYGAPDEDIHFDVNTFILDGGGEYSSMIEGFGFINNMIIYDVYTETPPTDSGWFGEIKNIIKDAVFGENASLDDAQKFTLNQISLWLTIIVILLPLIVVGVILVRCFR